MGIYMTRSVPFAFQRQTYRIFVHIYIYPISDAKENTKKKVIKRFYYHIIDVVSIIYIYIYIIGINL